VKLFAWELARLRSGASLMGILNDHDAKKLAILGPWYEHMMQEAARLIVAQMRAEEARDRQAITEGGKGYLDADEDE
jgi:hypothetical protein